MTELIQFLDHSEIGEAIAFFIFIVGFGLFIKLVD